MSKTSFRLFAGTDIGLRENNEDNFTVCPDLTHNEWMVPACDQKQTIPLGERGCLMVVADGMGGMNAGEVASSIAVKIVQQMFAPNELPPSTLEKPEAAMAYLKKVIICADEAVKHHCKDNPETEGMGSTIIMAWLLGGSVYVAWLGDSRAYAFTPDKGIVRLSKDHSYVQQLVDAGKLTEEEAMAHPQSNIITRSLGDNSQKALPDVVSHEVSDGEVILLCSDGLCGSCSDAEIAEIIWRHIDNLRVCKETLSNTALKAGGSDNITIALLQVSVANKDTHVDESGNALQQVASRWQNLKYLITGLLLGAAVILIGLRFCSVVETQEAEEVQAAQQEEKTSPEDESQSSLEDISAQEDQDINQDSSTTNSDEETKENEVQGEKQEDSDSLKSTSKTENATKIE